MTELNFITAAVAAASSVGFLAALALALVLFLTCVGLCRKVRRLQGALAAERRATARQAVTLARLTQEREELRRHAAALIERIKDLKLQRHMLGVALFDAVDELEAQEFELRATRIEARSANRQRLAAELRAERYEDELNMAEAENGRLRRRVETLEQTLLGYLNNYVIDLEGAADYLLPGESLTVAVETQQTATVGISSRDGGDIFVAGVQAAEGARVVIENVTPRAYNPTV